jgi:alpha-N-acetylgalactosaminidase
MCNTDCKNHPDSCISEGLYMAMADELVSGGYKDAGYTYVNIDGMMPAALILVRLLHACRADTDTSVGDLTCHDGWSPDCWQNRSRDADGALQADSERFPHGIKWLADEMHKRGLHLGIYTDYGSATCEGYPGTDLAHQEIDAQTFAAWGIDSVKVDGCNSNSSTMNMAYPRFGDLLNKTGRAMLYSCSWPDYLNDHVNFSYVGEKCNLWRMYRDIYSQWPIIEEIVEFYGDPKNAEMLQPIAGPTLKSEHVTCCAWEAVPMSTRHLLCMRSCAHVVRQHPPPSHPTHVFHTQDIHPWLQPILGNSRGKVRTFSCRAR